MSSFIAKRFAFSYCLIFAIYSGDHNSSKKELLRIWESAFNLVCRGGNKKYGTDLCGILAFSTDLHGEADGECGKQSAWCLVISDFLDPTLHLTTGLAFVYFSNI